MDFELISVRKVSRSKTRFNVAFSLDGERYEGVATIHPRMGHSIEFDPPELCAPLLRAGRRARMLAGALVGYYRGQKLELPMKFTGGDVVRSQPVLTVKPTRKPMVLTRAAG